MPPELIPYQKKKKSKQRSPPVIHLRQTFFSPFSSQLLSFAFPSASPVVFLFFYFFASSLVMSPLPSPSSWIVWAFSTVADDSASDGFEVGGWAASPAAVEEGVVEAVPVLLSLLLLLLLLLPSLP